MKRHTTPDMFPDVETTPRPDTRKIRAAHVAAMKEKWDIQTLHCDGEWIGVSMKEARERLAGYELDENEKTNFGCLMAGYARLVEDAGMIAEGHKTEYEAVEAIVQRLESSTE